MKEAALKAADAEILLTEDKGYLNALYSFILSFLEAEGMEKTFKFQQHQIQAELDIMSAKKANSHI